MSTVIHHRAMEPTASVGIYVDSIDRGPKGDKGDTGDKGDKGDKGDTGVGILKLYIDERDHLMAEFSNGDVKDAGEMPKILTKRVFAGNIDGAINSIPLIYNGKKVEISTDRISHVLINGITYTEGFEIRDGNLILSMPDVPSGKIEIFTNTHGISTEGAGAVTSVNGKVGDVEVKSEVEAISEPEINQVFEGE